MTKPDITEFMANAAKAEAAMNYPRCRTCKWWMMWLEEDDPATAEEGYCELAEADYPDVITNFPAAKHPDSLAYGHGADLTDVGLTTKPDFGCVQHAPRDEPEDAT